MKKSRLNIQKADDFTPDSRKEAESWVKEAEQLLMAFEKPVALTHVNILVAIVIGHPFAPFIGQQVEFDPISGIVLTRSGRWAKIRGNDEEEMLARDILTAPPPDVNYVWYVKLVRTLQSIKNLLLGWLLGRTMWDGPGSIKVKFASGEETLQIDFMVHPKAQWSTLLKYARIIERGFSALQWMADHPTFDEQVEQHAQLTLAVEKRVNQLKAEAAK